MERRFVVNLDLQQKISNNIIFVQDDTDSDIIEVHLTSNGSPVDIIGQTVNFWFQKADNTVVQQDSTSGVSIIDAASGKFQCILKNNSLALVGKLQVSIEFKKDSQILSTVIFNVNVAKGLNSNTVVLSTDELSILNTMQNDLDKKIQYCSYTAPANNTTNIPFSFIGFDSAHDDMIVSYKGVLLENPDNYTVNQNNNGIILADWSISANEVVKFRLYKNVK